MDRVINLSTGEEVIDDSPVTLTVIEERALYNDTVVWVRAKRNALLAETDWTMLADAPVDQAAWSAYRQALRDIPEQPGFPFDTVWPVKPN